MQQHDQMPTFVMGVAIDSGWLVNCEIEIDHGSRNIHCGIVLGSSGHNVIIKPGVFSIGGDGERAIASDRIAGIKYFLDGQEYDTRAIGGEPGEFSFYDLGYGGKLITIDAELTDGTVISYTLSYEIEIIEP